MSRWSTAAAASVSGGIACGLELAEERRHLPARLAVVGEDARRSLIGELEPEAAGPLDLADHARDPAVARGHGAGLADRLQRLELLLAAARGEMRFDDLVDRRGGGGALAERGHAARSAPAAASRRMPDRVRPLIAVLPVAGGVLAGTVDWTGHAGSRGPVGRPRRHSRSSTGSPDRRASAGRWCRRSRARPSSRASSRLVLLACCRRPRSAPASLRRSASSRGLPVGDDRLAARPASSTRLRTRRTRGRDSSPPR